MTTYTNPGDHPRILIDCDWDVIRCRSHHPQLEVRCVRIDFHAEHMAYDATGRLVSWQDEQPQPAVAVMHANQALANLIRACEALQANLRHKPAPVFGPKGEDLLLLDNNGNAWINLDHDAWVRAAPLHRGYGTVTRSQIDKKAGPLLEYVRRSPRRAS